MSNAAPLCRWCAREIPKQTQTVFVWEPGTVTWATDDGTKNILARLRSKAECQQHTDDEVVSVRYHDGIVMRFTTWDRASYVDDHFCSNRCAERFGRWMARQFPDHGSLAFSTAMMRRASRAGGTT